MTDERVCPNDQLSTLIKNAPSTSLNIVKVGTLIAGRFRIEELLGRGGFAAVFRATQLTTGQPVAVKVLESLQIADNDQLMRRFFAEARATAGLRHANTVRVYDFGQDDNGLLFIAMELLTGRTLKQELNERMKRGIVFTEAETVEIASAVAHSLSEAHHAGLVHRDLKPDNIFIHQVDGAEATVKVVDFGIVKLSGSNLTQQNNVATLGTPTYMSPEQALGAQDVDARSDIYSLATVLYELVSGDAPFRSANWQATIYKQISEAPADLRSVAKTPLSDEFVAAIHRALEKSAGARFANVTEFRRALSASLPRATSQRGPAPVAPAPQAAPQAAAPQAAPAARTLMRSASGRAGPTLGSGSSSTSLGSLMDALPGADMVSAPPQPSWMVPTAAPILGVPGSAPTSGLSVSLQAQTGPVPKTNYTEVHTPAAAVPQVGSLIEARYQLDEVLADAADGLVFRARRISDALPVVLLMSKDAERIERLYAIHRRVVSMSVPAAVERFSTSFGPVRFECLARQYFDGANLATLSRSRTLDEREVLDLLAKTLLALGDLAAANPPIFHPALSLEAVLVRANGQVGLIGLGARGQGSLVQEIKAVAGLGIQLLGGNPSGSPDAWRDTLHASAPTKNLLRSLASSGAHDLAEARMKVERVRDALPRSAPAPRPVVLGAPAPEPSTAIHKPVPVTREQLDTFKNRNLLAQSDERKKLIIGSATAAAVVAAGAFAIMSRGGSTSGAPTPTVFADATRGLISTLNFCAAGASGTHFRVIYAVGSDGRVISPSAVADGAGTKETVECLTGAVENWRYASFRGGFVLVTLPISFTAGGAKIATDRKVNPVRHFDLEWVGVKTTEGYDVDPYAEVLNKSLRGTVECMADASRRLVIPDGSDYNASARILENGAFSPRIAGSQLSGATWTADTKLANCILAELGKHTGPKPEKVGMELAFNLKVGVSTIDL
ncbi:MAG: serine/threonine protein kinase [Deltaproteobacteria bacterium]|nr:serine/threonine protein kinase [Deltaproteobacteria bacterium]